MEKKHKLLMLSGIGLLSLTLIFVIVLNWPKPVPPPPPKPVVTFKLPTAKGVGESIGKTTGDFGKGVVKGLWDSAKETWTKKEEPKEVPSSKKE